MSAIDPRDVRRVAKEAAAREAEREDALADALLAEVEQPPER